MVEFFKLQDIKNKHRVRRQAKFIMITIKNKEEIEILREGGKILALIMKSLASMVRPGVTTGDLEKEARKLIASAGGRPAQLGFAMPEGKKFPAALCVSLNSEIVHAAALPSRVINNGDIVSLDCVMEYPIDEKIRAGRRANKFSKQGGYYTDMALTVIAGSESAEAKKLISVANECLRLGIAEAKPGNALVRIGSAIQKHAEAKGFSVVRELVGHGVGHKLHEEPQIPNYAFPDKELDNPILEPGMVLAIEPMISIGDWRIKNVNKSFAFATKDGSLSAHCEHTVAIVDGGCLILTEE